MTISKEALRNILRDRRWGMSAQERMEKSKSICNHLTTVLAPEEAVLVYCAKEPEVQTNPLIRYLIESEIPTVVPIIQKEDVSLRLSYLQDPGCLIPSTFHVPEPVGAEIPANPEDITSAIIPMLGFDRGGGRLGYGAGYYDRFLSENRHIRTIGLAYACQEIPRLPTDDNDIGMNIIVTEDGVIKMNKGAL
jgi:5-formyltetrahydrofolate cyclo-ligase